MIWGYPYFWKHPSDNPETHSRSHRHLQFFCKKSQGVPPPRHPLRPHDFDLRTASSLAWKSTIFSETVPPLLEHSRLSQGAHPILAKFWRPSLAWQNETRQAKVFSLQNRRKRPNNQLKGLKRINGLLNSFNFAAFLCSVRVQLSGWWMEWWQSQWNPARTWATPCFSCKLIRFWELRIWNHSNSKKEAGLLTWCRMIINVYNTKTWPMNQWYWIIS